MGITYPIPLACYELGNTHQLLDATIGTVPSDLQIAPIYVPTSGYKGKVVRAYLDIYFPWIQNTNAGENHNQGGTYWQVSPNDITYTNATPMGDETFALPGSTIFTGLIRRVGTVDIAAIVNQAIAAGNLLYIKWNDAAAHANSMSFRLIYAILRIYARG